jgi:hypothetical protein
MHSSCPYKAVPPNALWRESIGQVHPAAVDPTLPSSLQIDKRMLLGSAGSCFAQHVRNHLVRRGYNYLIAEPGPGDLSEAERVDRSYGVFPARFGNVYTTVQLNQLFERAYGRFQPVEEHWVDRDAVYDPFRPNIEPGGFASIGALRADRALHLAAVREMFETVGVFVFTLGLTEAWRSRIDGAVFPVCPGCPLGTFQAARHEFVNFGGAETTAALFAFIDAFQTVNPAAKLVLTVSPVPLAATMSGQHVLQATTYSKSVLRVAAEEARLRFAHVSYFPAYEIITGTGRTHEFFAGDRRNITPAGVNRVMDLFFKCYAGEAALSAQTEEVLTARPAEIDEIICDEESVLRAMRASNV